MNKNARIFYLDGRIVEYTDQKLAYSVWLSLSKGVKAVFRGANDETPVYSHDYVDRL